MPSFEFDPAKSAANLAKHGIDFIEAQQLWRDDDCLNLEAPTKDDERRYQVIGRIGQTVWTAFITYRLGRIRLISVRHARKNERRWYASGNLDGN